MTIKIIRTLVSVLLVCLSGMVTIATADSNKLPDLMPVVIDASQGTFEVRNIKTGDRPRFLVPRGSVIKWRPPLDVLNPR